jgi:hypothetical protein
MSAGSVLAQGQNQVQLLKLSKNEKKVHEKNGATRK